MYTQHTKASSILADVKLDITNRKEWGDDQVRWRDKRLGHDKRKRLPYPGAPDIREPLIDDNITSLNSSEIQTIWGVRNLATFVPHNQAAYNAKAEVEKAFDSFLRQGLKIRSKLETLLDYKNERGMSIAKLVTRELNDQIVPDFEPIDPLNIVVPTHTLRLSEADRVAHIIRYTIREFLDQAQAGGWNPEMVHKAIQLAMQRGSEAENNQEANEEGASRAAYRDQPMPATGEVIVYEVYHWRSIVDGPAINSDLADNGESEQSTTHQTKEETFRLLDSPMVPFRTLIANDSDSAPLLEGEWTWPAKTEDIQVGVDEFQVPVFQTREIEPATNRPWPFVQFRFENRTQLYHETRGVAQKVAQDQIVANANLNAKAVMMDYTAKPFLTGPVANSFKWRPGDTIPTGVGIEFPVAPTQNLDFNVDQVRALSAKRVGAVHGALLSTNPNASSKSSKTATESSITARASALFTADSAERFSEPFGEILTMIWDFMTHNHITLRSVGTESFMTEMPQEYFDLPFTVVPTVSGKDANPVILLAQIQEITQLLGTFPELKSMIRGGELLQLLIDTIHPALTDRIVVDPTEAGPAGQPPIEQVLNQLLGVVMGPEGDGQSGLIAQVGHNTEFLAEIAADEVEAPKPATEPAS